MARPGNLDATASGASLGPDLAALLARVEAAEGADRELDFAVHQISMGDWLLRHGYERRGDGYWSDSPPVSGANHAAGPEPFTASLDAVLALCARVLPTLHYALRSDGWLAGQPQGKPVVALYDDDFDPDGKHFAAAGKTPALALLAAMLKALIAQGEADTSDRLGIPGKDQS